MKLDIDKFMKEKGIAHHMRDEVEVLLQMRDEYVAANLDAEGKALIKLAGELEEMMDRVGEEKIEALMDPIMRDENTAELERIISDFVETGIIDVDQAEWIEDCLKPVADRITKLETANRELNREKERILQRKGTDGIENLGIRLNAAEAALESRDIDAKRRLIMLGFMGGIAEFVDDELEMFQSELELARALDWSEWVERDEAKRDEAKRLEVFNENLKLCEGPTIKAFSNILKAGEGLTEEHKAAVSDAAEGDPGEAGEADVLAAHRREQAIEEGKDAQEIAESREDDKDA